MVRTARISLLAAAVSSAILLAACGGGGGGKGSSGTDKPTPDPVVPPSLLPLVVANFEAAQTHVLPEAGLSWTLAHASGALHLTAQRDALVMLELGDAQPIKPMLEGWFNDAKLGAVALNAPGLLPPTEAAGPAYATKRYSANVPAAWVKPGLQLRVIADNYSASNFKKPEIGLDTDFDMRILPFYLFGANDNNTQPLSVTGTPDTATYNELYAKWPVARLNVSNHPAQRIVWPTMVIGPVEANNAPAYVVSNKDQQHGGYEIMGATLGILSAMRDANGESDTNNQYYAPLLMLGADGKYADPYGGLGGGSRGTGDYRYAGIFIHEQGHAFGMPHAEDGYNAGKYPYVRGSLAGSAWAYDAGRATFLAPFLPADASTFAACKADTARIKDSAGRCVKQDPMQGGSGDQAKGYRFTAFSDFNAGVIQRYFEGVTSVDKDGVRQYDGAKILVDAASSTGYSRWDSIDKKRVELTPKTTDKGLYGFNMGLPIQRNVAVQTIIITYSLAGTSAASQIYPPVAYQGNLLRQVDPTVTSQLAEITPNTGPVPWYCHASGCDYTLRVTYNDATVQHTLLQGGFRSWFSPTGAVPADALNAVKDKSFKVWGLNVAARTGIKKIELLDTPQGWKGLPSIPQVLLSRTN